MSSYSESPADAQVIAQRQRRLNQIVEELSRLAESTLAPGEFYAEFLQRVLNILGAPAGAVWGRTGQGHLQLHYHINLSTIGLDRIENAQACHHEVLRQVVTQGRPVLLQPRSGPGVARGNAGPANLTGYLLLIVPIIVEKQVTGLLEVWQHPQENGNAQRGSLVNLGRLADFAAAYIRNTKLRMVLGQQQLWTQLEAYSRQIHASLSPREVGYLVVNEGRRLISCDRVCVALRLGRKTWVEAISGVDVIEKRGAMVRTMQKLCDRVLAWGEKLVFTGTKDESLPPAVIEALDAYLAESPAKLLIVMPLKDEREKDSSRPGRSAMLVECFEPTMGQEQLAGRMEVVARHATPALYNALEYYRIPASWLWQPLAKMQDSLRGKRGAQVGAIAAAVLLLLLALILVPYPHRMEGKGQLLPKDRQIVFSLIPGEIVRMRAQHGENVEKDQVLMFMRNLELQKQLGEFKINMDAAQNTIKALKEQLEKTKSDSERGSLYVQIIKLEFTYLSNKLRYEILLEQVGQDGLAPVRAPIDGTVVTFDLHEQLVGKTVEPGHPLVRVANRQGPWEIEMFIPEAKIGPIREAFAKLEVDVLDVDVLLTSDPNRTFKCKLYRDGLGGETTIRENAVVLPARVEIDDPELIELLPNMAVGVEVRAKVRCGNRAIGYVWFHELWEWFYENVVF